MAERLYAVAAEFAGLSGSERVFDLYCGIGTIGLTMAAQAGEVWGLEIVPEAIADAERNAERNGIENAHFVAGNARTGVRPLIEQAGKPDVVVVDPPRAGLSQKIVRRVIECEAKRIVYVSCNPTTLAPNAAQLGRGRLYAAPREAGRHVPPDPAHRVRGAAGEASALMEPRASESPPGSTPRSRGRWPRAAPSSATTRSGPTTTPAPRAWRRWPSSPPRRRERRPRRRRDRARPHAAGGDRRRHRAARPRPARGSGSASAPASRRSR